MLRAMSTAKQISMKELLDWINEVVDREDAHVTQIEEVGSGGALCLIMILLYPGCIKESTIKPKPNLTENDSVNNLKLLDSAFNKLNIEEKKVPVEDMSKKRTKPIFDFSKWFYYKFSPRIRAAKALEAAKFVKIVLDQEALTRAEAAESKVADALNAAADAKSKAKEAKLETDKWLELCEIEEASASDTKDKLQKVCGMVETSATDTKNKLQEECEMVETSATDSRNKWLQSFLKAEEQGNDTKKECETTVVATEDVMNFAVVGVEAVDTTHKSATDTKGSTKTEKKMNLDKEKPSKVLGISQQSQAYSEEAVSNVITSQEKHDETITSIKPAEEKAEDTLAANKETAARCKDAQQAGREAIQETIAQCKAALEAAKRAIDETIAKCEEAEKAGIQAIDETIAKCKDVHQGGVEVKNADEETRKATKIANDVAIEAEKLLKLSTEKSAEVTKAAEAMNAADEALTAIDEDELLANKRLLAAEDLLLKELGVKKTAGGFWDTNAYKKGKKSKGSKKGKKK